MLVLQKIGKIVLVNIYLVIIAGSVVRMTGSGMGCPDWPMCFGLVIPPTSEEEITWKPNYDYKKGQMIIHSFSGIQETNEIESAVEADALIVAQSNFKSSDSFNQNNWEKYKKHDYAIFNVYHTWTEYINRLFGALLGFFALIMLFLSIKKWRQDKWLSILAVLQLFFIGFEAWLGKVTVDYNLAPVTITYHMLGVLVLIVLQLLYLKRVKELVDVTKVDSEELIDSIETSKSEKKGKANRLIIGLVISSIILLIIQIVIGTQVRQEVDLYLSKGIGRQSIVNEFSVIPYIHRSFSILLVLTISFFSWKLWKYQLVKKLIVGLNLVMWGGILIGIYLFYFGLPAVGQPFHLFFSLLLFGYLTQLLLKLKKS